MSDESDRKDEPPLTSTPNWNLLEEEATVFADRLSAVGMHYQAYQLREIRDLICQRRDKERGFGPWR